MMSAPSGLAFFARADDADLDAQELAEQLDRTAVRRRRRWRLGLAGTAALAVVGIVTSTLVSATAASNPSANDWYRLRMCESTNNYQANTGNGHYGAYQFDQSTWTSVGGTGLPSSATPAEQDKRALLLYQSRGWQPWQCAKIVGLVGGGFRFHRSGAGGRPIGSTGRASRGAGDRPRLPGPCLRPGRRQLVARGVAEADARPRAPRC